MNDDAPEGYEWVDVDEPIEDLPEDLPPEGYEWVDVDEPIEDLPEDLPPEGYEWVDVDQPQEVESLVDSNYSQLEPQQRASLSDFASPELADARKDAYSSGLLATFKNASDMVRGGERAVNTLSESLVGDSVFNPVNLEKRQAYWDEKMQPHRERNPVATTLMPMASEALYGSSKLLGNAIIGGVFGGLRPEDSISANFINENLNHPAIGVTEGVITSVLGDRAGKYLSRYFNSKIGSIDPDYDMDDIYLKRREELKANGYELTPYEQTGSKPQYIKERQAKRAIGQGEVYQGMTERNLNRFQDDVLEHFGIDAKNFDENTYRRLSENIGRKLDEYETLGEFKVDPAYYEEMLDLQRKWIKFPNELKAIQKELRDIYLVMPDNRMDMKYITKRSSLLKGLGRKADGEMKHAYNQMADALDYAAERALVGDKYKEIRKVRGLYKDSLALDGSIDSSTGKLDPWKFANSLESRDTYNYKKRADIPFHNRVKAYTSVFKKGEDGALDSGSVIGNLAGILPSKLYLKKAMDVRNAYKMAMNPDIFPFEDASQYLGGVLGRELSSGN